MSHYSLLGHLVRQFTTFPENLATEGLNYILARSSVARHALIQLVAQTSGLEVAGDLTFQTQDLRGDGAMPDLVGVNLHGQQPLVIEAKFWAGLTQNQPKTYINRLPPDAPGVVVFIAPTPRLDGLWSELVSRCRDARLPEARASSSGADPRSLRLTGRRGLTLMSWGRLLGVLVREMEAAGETGLVSDAQQLLGLCEQFDGAAFLPLHPEKPASEAAEAMSRPRPLIEAIVAHMVDRGVGIREGMYRTSGPDWYGCYVDVAPYLFLVSIDERHQAHYADTPYWLGLYRKPGQPLSTADKLRVPQPCLFVTDQFGGDHCLVPLFPPAEVGQDEVVRQLVDQIRRVDGYLRGGKAG